MTAPLEVQIAVLGAKLDAIQNETRAALEAIRQLLTERLNDLAEDHAHLRTRCDKVEDRLSVIERAREKAAGWIAGAIAVSGAIGGAIAFAADKLIR